MHERWKNTKRWKIQYIKFPVSRKAIVKLFVQPKYRQCFDGVQTRKNEERRFSSRENKNIPSFSFFSENVQEKLCHYLPFFSGTKASATTKDMKIKMWKPKALKAALFSSNKNIIYLFHSTFYRKIP